MQLLYRIIQVKILSFITALSKNVGILCLPFYLCGSSCKKTFFWRRPKTYDDFELVIMTCTKCILPLSSVSMSKYQCRIIRIDVTFPNIVLWFDLFDLSRCIFLSIVLTCMHDIGSLEKVLGFELYVRVTLNKKQR